MPPRGEPQRHPAGGVTSARDAGDRAEERVAEWLLERGLSLLGRKVRVGRYEIDILALDHRSLVVIEVRSRGANAWTTGFSSIDAAKRRRLRAAGERLWRTRYKHDPRIDHVRFDAASVTFAEEGTAHVEYARAAF